MSHFSIENDKFAKSRFSFSVHRYIPNVIIIGHKYGISNVQLFDVSTIIIWYQQSTVKQRNNSPCLIQQLLHTDDTRGKSDELSSSNWAQTTTNFSICPNVVSSSQDGCLSSLFSQVLVKEWLIPNISETKETRKKGTFDKLTQTVDRPHVADDYKRYCDINRF